MSTTVIIQKFGDIHCLPLPQEELDRLGWQEGKQIEFYSDARHIEFFEPGRAPGAGAKPRALIAETVMKNFYVALRKLAKP